MIAGVIDDGVLVSIGGVGVVVCVVLLALNRPRAGLESGRSRQEDGVGISRATRMVFILCGLFGFVQVLMHGLTPAWARLKVPDSAFWVVGLGMAVAIGLSFLTDMLEQRAGVAGESEPDAEPDAELGVPDEGPSS